MKKCLYVFVLVLFGSELFGSAGVAKEPVTYLSPSVLVAGDEGEKLYIALATANQVAEFDIAKEQITRRFSLAERPSGLALAPDQSCLYVTTALPNGKVFAVNLKTGEVRSILSLGHTPTAPVVSPDGETLYVCNRFNNNVAVVDLASSKTTAKISVPREPIAAALTPDGKFLLVANHLPAGAADQDYTAATVSVIDTGRKERVAELELPNGSTGLRGICVSPDGKHAYVTHILARYQLPTTQLERGWMNTNALSVIDIAEMKRVDTVLLDNVDLGAASPWAVTCTADGKHICASHAGTHELSVINRTELHDKLNKAASVQNEDRGVGTGVIDVSNNLAFLVEIRRRIKLAGKGPRGLAIIGRKVYVAEYFTDSLGVVGINSNARPRVRSVALGPKKPLTKVRKGEMLFHDAALCFQQWQSCSSCHPDGRADALNWDLLNDGIGNPKNTKSLLLAHKTPPAMVTGVRGDAEAAVRAGIRHIQFVVRPEEDAVAIDEYLKSLEPVPSPHLVNGKLSDSAQRGRAIFEKAGCAACHKGPLFTDLKEYDVAAGNPTEQDQQLDTPTLVEVWRTAPYLYDGRATTIREVLTKYNPNDRHGKTSELSQAEMKDLIAFVLSQ